MGRNCRSGSALMMGRNGRRGSPLTTAMGIESIMVQMEGAKRLILAGSGVFLVVFVITDFMLALAVGESPHKVQIEKPFFYVKDLSADSRYGISSSVNESYVVRGIAAGDTQFFLSMCKYDRSQDSGFVHLSFRPQQTLRPLWCKVVIYNNHTNSFTEEIGSDSQLVSSSPSDVFFRNPTSLALSNDESMLFVLDNDNDTIYAVDLTSKPINVKPLLWFRGPETNVSIVYNVGSSPPREWPAKKEPVLSVYSQMAYDRKNRMFYVKVNDCILIFPEAAPSEGGADGGAAGGIKKPETWLMQTSDMVGLALTSDGRYLFVSDIKSSALFRCSTNMSSESGYICPNVLPSGPFQGYYVSLAVSSGGGCDLFACGLLEDERNVAVYHLRFLGGGGNGQSSKPEAKAANLGYPAFLALKPDNTQLLVVDFQEGSGSTVFSLDIDKARLLDCPVENISSGALKSIISQGGAATGGGGGGGLDKQTDDGTNAGLIAGLVIGGITLGVLLTIVIWHRRCGIAGFKRKRCSMIGSVDSGRLSSSVFGGQTASEYGWTAHTTVESVSSDSKRPKGAGSSASEPRSLPGLTHYSYDALRAATTDFSQDNKIGTPGAFGQVYKGVLESGKEVAIKVMKGHLTTGKYQQFQAEVALQGDLNHVHVCKLLGFCEAQKGMGVGQELLLVYPYVQSGSLYDNLHGKEGATVVPLDVKARVTIALHVAKGLRYLHEEADRPVYHRDVKSHNILLDMAAGPESLCAKLADFGIAKMGETLFQPDRKGAVETTHLCGTQGYMAPEYVNAGIVGPKNDVHAFGVVLLELITGKKAVIEEPERQSLVSFVKPRLNHHAALMRIIDPRLWITSTEGVNFQALHDMAQIAARCTNPTAEERPSMGTIINELGVINDSLSSP